ncbi:MAG: TRAP transporter large permease subunit [Stellaceae bacterium]
MLGRLVDMAPPILVTTPILLPVVMKFGVDPVYFGMIMLLDFGIGPMSSASRRYAVCRLRCRARPYGRGDEADLAVFTG